VFEFFMLQLCDIRHNVVQCSYKNSAELGIKITVYMRVRSFGVDMGCGLIMTLQFGNSINLAPGTEESLNSVSSGY
jgi:hypothetical protein